MMENRCLRLESYDCRPAVSGFGWSLPSGNPDHCLAVPKAALVCRQLHRACLDVLFGVFLLSRFVGSIAVCKFPTPTATNSSLTRLVGHNSHATD